MRLAFFGGSFDPFHNGHLAIVRALRDRDLCDELLIAPAALSPGKALPSADGRHRLRMAEAAVAGIDGVTVTDVDLRRPGPSYTVTVLEDLRRERPDADLVLVVGADAWRDFDAWREPDRILELAEILVFPRGGVSGAPARVGARIRRLEAFDVPVSATVLRARLARGESVDGLVPTPVVEYIRRHDLYGVRPGRARGGEGSCP